VVVVLGFCIGIFLLGSGIGLYFGCIGFLRTVRIILPGSGSCVRLLRRDNPTSSKEEGNEGVS
jgi:hypothetical protein